MQTDQNGNWLVTSAARQTICSRGIVWTRIPHSASDKQTWRCLAFDAGMRDTSVSLPKVTAQRIGSASERSADPDAGPTSWT